MTPNEKTVVVGASVASFLLGGAISYYATRKVMTTQFEKLINKELQEVKEYYARRAAREGEMLQEENQQIIEELEYSNAPKVEEITITETYLTEPPHRVADDVEFDYAEELLNRTKERPYVIHVDEFMANEENYDQVSITYYEGDDILTDEKDVPIPKRDEIVGDDNLYKFGHGSKDNRVVYIRNEILELEFEIIHRDGKFSREVMGFIEHSEPRGRPRKFRSWDE